MARTFTKHKGDSFWRRIAMATWTHPRNPQVLAPLDIDATAMLEVIEDVREATGVKVTPTHFVGKAVGEALSVHPEVNGIIVRGTVRTRETVDVWFNVAFDEGDLFGAKVDDIEDKGVVEVAQRLTEGAAKIRKKGDKRLGNYSRLTRTVPNLLLRPLLWLVDVLNYRLGIPLGWAGVEKDPFGSAMVTNIATFDQERAYAPIPPLMRLPVVIVTGAIHEKAVVRDGEVVPCPILPLSITVDHRYLDGFQAARMAREFVGFLEDEARLRAACR
ncbi:MAG: 2-oxo acid dehydrogenase subunit E2 [Candidatus Thermoplasmatota archaeon]|nr:2-oxo acid dehydrogenase subunit E2 [Candidatus Thermoplasmatota archaeon]